MQYLILNLNYYSPVKYIFGKLKDYVDGRDEWKTPGPLNSLKYEMNRTPHSRKETKFFERRDEPDAPFPEGGSKDVIGWSQ